jgi:hypothetical protein
MGQGLHSFLLCAQDISRHTPSYGQLTGFPEALPVVEIERCPSARRLLAPGTLMDTIWQAEDCLCL